MRGFAGSMLVLVLIAAAIATALAIDAPILAVPLVFLIVTVWGGARLATVRGRAT